MHPAPRSPRRILWVLFPGVRPAERARFLFFLSLSSVISFAQTLGIVAAESLFLARVGPEHLPAAFVLAAAVTVAGSLGYALVVGRARNDLLFEGLLVAAGGALLFLGVGAQRGVAGAPTALLCAYYLTFSVFLNHFWTFAGDYFDTLASKRLFPLFQVGSSLGGLVGGLGAVAATRLGSPELLVYAWAILLAVGAGIIAGARAMLRHWYPVELEERDESSVEGIRVATRYLRRSALGRSLVLSTAGMVLALFVMQYLYSEVFVRAFPEEATLAAFLGLYLAVTNLIEIGTEVVVTPALIRRLGVGAANLVHPVLTLVSFGLLAVDYRLYAAVLARVNREMLENALAGPVRALVQNAFPLRLRGKVRAFLEGIVVYAGMVLAGGVLLAIGPLASPLWVCAAGLSAGALYLMANLRVRDAYLASLVADVRSGRVDLRERSEDLASLPTERLTGLWRTMLALDAAPFAPSIRQLARVLARRGLVDALLGAARHPDAAVRQAVVAVLDGGGGQEALLQALDDPDAEVRLAAVTALGRAHGEGNGAARVRLRERIEDPDPRVRAVAARALGDEDLLARMARSPHASTARAALLHLSPSLVEVALEGAEAKDPEIRAAALEALAGLAPPVRLDLQRLIAELSHSDARVRAAAASVLARHPEPEAHAALARALADPSREVRERAARSLARLGERGVDLALARLDEHPLWAWEAALRAVAWSDTPLAQPILVNQLRLRARQAWSAQRVLRLLPKEGGASARFLRAAYEDALSQNRKLAFRILELLEEPGVVRTIEKVLLFGSGRLRADALEVLSHLGDREAARLLVATLEEEPASEPSPVDHADRILEETLREAMRAMHRWIRIASAARADRAALMEATMERLLALRNVSLFSQMSLDQLEAINGLLTEQEFVAGEVIFTEGDPGTDLYLVAEGSVDVVKSHGTAEAIRLARLGVGSSVGEIAVLDESPRTATAVAREDCRLLRLSGDRFKELIYDMPELAFAIFRVLTRQVRRADERLAELVRAGAPPGDGD